MDLIRKQPFSVVLLDEFEKANYRIWDLFLQVFDDGRLTDRSGITADFRHRHYLMTSNLGSTIPSGTSLGFSPDSSRFSPTTVEKAVNQAFRKEFLNRIDRVIVFRPLGRDTMREILRKENWRKCFSAGASAIGNGPWNGRTQRLNFSWKRFAGLERVRSNGRSSASC
ncbi:MAG: AAA family ATPase [Terriglobia bacterium]